MVRDPLKRAVSVYYFWGELFRIQAEQKEQKGQRRKKNKKEKEEKEEDPLNGKAGKGYRLGESGAGNREVALVHGALFDYHGDEGSVPPKG